ncbi:MAG: (2Fe-2S)-binding protein [Phormidesmis sp. RL_2_1]|nr:(2Fe-2S)-binding protein [Phormidesmis sp. RL_2_1]
MPTITAQGKTFECQLGANLRQALLDYDVDLYSPRANYVNCMGIGTCGTCAVSIEGKVSEVNWRDRTRRSLPPHQPHAARRLACQTQVLGDIRVTKYTGFWGHEDRIAWKPEGFV